MPSQAQLLERASELSRRTARSYGDYVDDKKRKSEKPMGKDEWEARQKGEAPKKPQDGKGGASRDNAVKKVLKKYPDVDKGDLADLKKELAGAKDQTAVDAIVKEFLSETAASREHDRKQKEKTEKGEKAKGEQAAKQKQETAKAKSELGKAIKKFIKKHPGQDEKSVRELASELEWYTDKGKAEEGLRAQLGQLESWEREDRAKKAAVVNQADLLKRANELTAALQKAGL